MASLLDISLLGYFSDIFVIVFVFTATYGILLVKSPFGDNKGLNALIAFAVSFMLIFSKDAITIVKNTVPWFIIIMLVLVMALMVTKSIGASWTSTIMESMGTWILVIGIVIFVINLGFSLGPSAGPYLGSNGSINPDSVVAGSSGDVASNNYAQNFSATLFHPKVLALILIFIISIFSVLLIGYWI
jgi:hypothetical protein